MKIFKGLTFQGESGNTYIIEKTISIGTGQGDIFLVRNDRKERFALKLFHTGDRKLLERQIDRLIRRGQACEAFVAPLEKVEINDRLGYLMEYVTDDYVSASVLYNGIEENGRIVNVDWFKKLSCLYEIVSAFSIINSAKLGVMDIKFENILVNLEDCQIKILDTDTIVSVGDKSMVRGTVGFMPPLTMTGKEKPNKYNDVYTIAVLIFMALMGLHPLDGKRRNQRCNEDIDSYLYGTHPVYIFHPTDTSNRAIPQDNFSKNQQYAIDKISRYPKYFIEAMEKTFVKGLFKGEDRTTMAEWKTILEKLYADSFICENCGEERFFNETIKICNVCGANLKRPIVLECEKRLPLFLGMTVFSDDLFATTQHYELFKIVTTKFSARVGVENLRHEKAAFHLPSGVVKTVSKNEILPLFLGGEIEIENKKIQIKEM